MGLGKILFIGVLLIIAVAYFSPSTYDKGKYWVLDKLNIQKDKTTNYVYQTIAENNSITVESTPEENEVNTTCGYKHYGYPDFEGTEKEGEKCKTDNDCIANPPINYDGKINLVTKESEPELICCSVDGTCQW